MACHIDTYFKFHAFTSNFDRFEDLRCGRGRYRFENTAFWGEHVVLNCSLRLADITRLPNQNIRAAFFDEVILFLPEAIRSAKERRVMYSLRECTLH